MLRTAAALLVVLSAVAVGDAAGATATAADASKTAADPEARAREEVLWQTVNDLKTRLDGVEVDFELEKGKSRGLEGEVSRLRARVEVLEGRQEHGSSSSVDRRRLGDSPGETQIIHKRRLAYQHKCVGPGEQNGECPDGCVCSPPTWPDCGTPPPPDCSGHHRRTQEAEVCTEAEVPQWVNAINRECCDETTESCRSGQPETCNIGCAAVVLPFWAECRAPFTKTVGQATVDTFQQVVDKCQTNESAGEKKPLATEFALVCDAHDAADCIPECNETLHGHILLATVDGDDSAYTCELHHGMYSWNGKAGAGGFMGSDVLSFIASVLSGAGGFYVALIIENNAHVDVELLVRPQQTVSIRGDPGVQSDGDGSKPIWGADGFTVQQYGSLRLKNLVLQAAVAVGTGGSAALEGCMLRESATLTVSGGGRLSLASMQVPATTLTVAGGSALTLGSPLTLMDGANTLFAWSSSARNVTFGSGGVTLADAQGATLGTATGAWPGTVELDLSVQNTTITGEVHAVSGQHAHVVGSPGSRVTFSAQVTVGNGTTFTLDGGGSAAFAGGVTVADGGTLTLGGPLTLVDGLAALADLAHSAGHASFGSGGVTLADAHGATLGTATGAWPGDVWLTHLSAAGQAALTASGASATLSRDAHGEVTASGMPASYFVSASGPCTLTHGGRCAHRGYDDSHSTAEHCDLVVGWGGTLSACPSFFPTADVAYLTIGGTRYDQHRGCPKGVRMATGSTITWTSTNLDRSTRHGHWEICF
eukprot:COSAG01_NODE_9337_length_2479_cov_50.643277_1_plen_764_part_00